MKRGLAALLIMPALSAPAAAHSAARGFVLLLPTANVILGGAAAVLLSFAVMALVPQAKLARLFAWRQALFALPLPPPRVTGALSGVIVATLLAAGYLGTRDPLGNPLPLAVWTLWWGAIVLAHALLGRLWPWLDPLAAISFRDRARGFPAYLPSLAIFAAFAWFQLVDAAPEDPARLAGALLVYFALSLAAMALFGSARWRDSGDPFAVFLRLVGAAAPLSCAGGRLALQAPAAGLMRLAALPTAGVLFVLLTLSSISFDALANTFLWLSAIGINPLDFPGRSLVRGANTLGLAGSFAALTLAYYGAVALGATLSGATVRAAAGRFVVSLIPISIAFHFAHYLPDLLVNGQYLLLALNDPFGGGWNLLGMAGRQVTASFLNTAGGAQSLYMVQTDAIIAGHIAAVVVAHALAAEMGKSRAAALMLEAPLALLMVAYTALGLWMLSTPAIA